MADFQSLLEGLKAAAEPSRLRLLAICARSELTVTEEKAAQLGLDVTTIGTAVRKELDR